MAQSRPLANHSQSLAASGFASPAPLRPSHDSVAMEQSISSSSISSSVASFLTSSSSSSAQSSSYMPTTPQRPPQTFNSISNDHGNANLRGKEPAAFTMALGMKKPLDISNLMSPPEPDQLDSFSINNGDDSRRGSVASVDLLGGTSILSGPQIRSLDRGVAVPRNGPLSPPVSPKDQKAISAAADAPLVAAQGSRDPILYPASNDNSPSASQSRPLFSDAADTANFPDNDTVRAAADIVSDHVAARSPTLFRRASPPRGEDYELALYLKSEVMKSYIVDRRGWLKKERDQLLADRRAAANRNKRLHLIFPASKPASMPAPRNLTPRVLKAQFAAHEGQPSQQLPLQREQLPSLHPVHDSSNRVAKRASRAPAASRGSLPARIAPQVNGTSRQASNGSGGNARAPGSSPEPRIRTSAPNREDKDFMSLPDYCPPLSTLPERTNNLKVDWKGTALDLSRDPYLHLLHRDEVGLAASLRLDCATYLTSKRRIFIRRLECARHPKEFRKTDAQQACKIDVNKASKLWTAYEKVGWLRIEHIRRFV